MSDRRQMEGIWPWYVCAFAVCEKGNIWLSGAECYRYTGASAYCRSNGILDDNEVFFRLQLKNNESVRTCTVVTILSLLRMASL